MSVGADTPAARRGFPASASPLSTRETEHFEKLLALFCANRRGTHGYAKSTVAIYRAGLTRAVREIGRPPWEWVPSDVDLLLGGQAERGLAAGTQLGAITVLRSFQNYVLEDVGLCNEIQREFGFRPQRYITSENSIPYRRQGRKPSRLVTPLTPEHCAALLDEYQFQIDVASRQRSKSYQPLRRDYVITVLGLSYGLRAAEISGIEIPHFLSDRKYPKYGRFALLRVIGKGPKLRVVRLYAPGAAEVLGWYVDHVRAAFLTTSTRNPNLLFLSERGCPLCARQYRRSLSNVAAAAGLPMRVHPHLLRHTYATEMAPIIGPHALQEQLGHEHLSTTLGTYYHPDPERVGNEVALGIEAVTTAMDQITQEASHANHR